MNILVAVDFSNASQMILEKTRTLALALSAKVYILHVIEQEPDLDDEFGSETLSGQLTREFPQEYKELQEEVDKLRKSDIDATAILTQGITIETIVQKSKKLAADIIIVGSHGHGGVHHLMFGSVSEGILQRASCPVLVIPTHDRT
ncbi:MAG: universal stress protein [Candidatus Scalindua sp.]|nr:universal stress protein [Candidatus Scalindua sp.]